MGDLLLSASFNVTGIRDPEEIERIHFLDSLSLLRLPVLSSAARVADVGSGGGLPALVLAIARLGMQITSIESQRKKCEHVRGAADSLGLGNVRVWCGRAEDFGRSEGRATYDVAVSRAVAALSVVAEYSLPLVRVGGSMVAMKGAVSDQERTRAADALGILGAGRLEAIRMDPFEGSRDRWVYVAQKTGATPDGFPRRAGIPTRRPLG